MVVPVERRLAAIMSADIVGYTRLMHKDEEGTLDRLKTVNTEIMEPKITEYRGRIVKLLGDGWLVEFSSAVDAVRCTADIQRANALRNGGLPQNEHLVLRMGINLGDVIVEGDDIYGDGVNVATRMQEIAQPGGVSVSGIVYESVRDKLSPAFEDLGPQHVKNLTDPVRAYRVVLDREVEDSAAKSNPAKSITHLREAAEIERLSAIMGSTQRNGSWTVPQEIRAVAFMGSIDLDFRDALMSEGVTELKTVNIMGQISIEVPDHVVVECDGIGIMGQFDQRRSKPDSPASATMVLKISGIAVMAQTTIH